VASAIAVDAMGQAAGACSFMVPQKPKSIMVAAGMVVFLVMVGAFDLIVLTPVVTLCSREKPSQMSSFSINVLGWVPDFRHPLICVIYAAMR
jgi:hypothetical protein